MVTAQFVKQPGGPEWASDSEMREYPGFLRRWASNKDTNDFVALSGYVNAEDVALVLQRCGDELTPENLLKQTTSIRGTRLCMLLRGRVLRDAAQARIRGQLTDRLFDAVMLKTDPGQPR